MLSCLAMLALLLPLQMCPLPARQAPPPGSDLMRCCPSVRSFVPIPALQRVQYYNWLHCDSTGPCPTWGHPSLVACGWFSRWHTSSQAGHLRLPWVTRLYWFDGRTDAAAPRGWYAGVVLESAPESLTTKTHVNTCSLSEKLLNLRSGRSCSIGRATLTRAMRMW